MTIQTRHFVLTPEGTIREFTPEQAALIAAGAGRLPEFAGHDLRYLQLTLENVPDSDELRIQTVGARIHFDEHGRLSEAGPPAESEPITRFEHDAVVQWALRDLPAVAPTFH
ncbi:hypothetical protein SAMN04488120_103251 [Fontimonas thermophila]|uniref:Uncharacterized protein n=1 Tax=Fontimonas thermophila TaxID=1076937 RepID=A0A1I2IFE8_9GAMM|nr:hypothetical protein [Fontimonas thermophila]SFF40373.1 hypothetical protein SAMN04488120_103251 [Fontimonas thermophila]